MIKFLRHCLLLLLVSGAAMLAPVQSPAQTAQPPGKSDRLLIPSLVGLRFVDNANAISASGVTISGVAIEGHLAFRDDDELRDALTKSFIGHPLYASDLDKIADIVKAWYRRHSLPVVSVIFPQQPFNNGVAQAVVTVFKLGHVRVVGNRWFAASLLKAEMELAEGEPIDFDLLKGDLDRLNRNPFHNVDAVLVKSETPGETDIELRVQDRLPLRVFASYDDEGALAMGRDRYSVGATVGNVLALDQQLSYEFTASPDLFSPRHRGAGLSDDPAFESHSASWMAPLPWGGSLTVFGAYAQEVPNIGSDFGQLGHNLQIGGRYGHALWPIGDLSQQIQLGFDFKRTNNNLAFGGYEVFSSSTDIEQFLLIYDGTLPDSLGQTGIENQLVYSPGGFSHANTTAIFEASGVNGAHADYVYDNLGLTRLFTLPWKLSAFLRAQGQLASTELLPSEQLGIGGEDTVRGYDLRAANGSQGVIASAELRSPTVSPLQFGWSAAPDKLQLLAFCDYGDVAYKYAQQSQRKWTSLSSVGFGARYTLSRFVDARFDYGWQLAKAPGQPSLGSLATVSVTVGY